MISMDISIANISLLKSFDTEEMIGRFGLKPYLFYSQIFSVLFPAIIFILIFHYKTIFKWIKIKLPFNNAFFLYSTMFLFLSYPLIQLSADINESMPFVNWMSEESGMIERLMKEILVMDSPLDLLVNIIIIAFIPAIGEELFFRVGIQNELIKGIGHKDFAIILTAIIFSAFHFQFDGFLPRFFLGLLLGYFYFWSGSFWLSFFIHFLNNGMLVFSAYMMQDKLEDLANDSAEHSIPKYILLMSIVAVFVLRKKMIELWKERIEVEKEIDINENT